MSAIEAVIVAAFVIFAGVLAWAERQTRDLPRAGSPKKTLSRGRYLGPPTKTLLAILEF
jgi:hypothetical protein